MTDKPKRPDGPPIFLFDRDAPTGDIIAAARAYRDKKMAEKAAREEPAQK